MTRPRRTSNLYTASALVLLLSVLAIAQTVLEKRAAAPERAAMLTKASLGVLWPFK